MIKVVEIRHGCGEVLGCFTPMDDHTGVNVVCPKCRRQVGVFNGQLGLWLDREIGSTHTEHNGTHYEVKEL